jgi:endonuclease YncB( thermonuclease family)
MKRVMNRLGTASLLVTMLCLNDLAYAESPVPDRKNEFITRIIAVLDGDTVLIRRHGILMRIRLAEIDAPEKAQAYGETSRRSLSDMVMGKPVKFIVKAVDRYGRMVANLYVAGLDVNSEQVRRGMAWEYSNFHGNRVMVALQDEARRASRGLWAQDHPDTPWKWRKLHPYLQRADAPVSASQRMIQQAQ